MSRREELPPASGFRAGYGSLPQAGPPPPAYAQHPPPPGSIPIPFPMFAAPVPPFGAYPFPGPPPPGMGVPGPIAPAYPGYQVGIFASPAPPWLQHGPFGFFHPPMPRPPPPSWPGVSADPVPGQDISGGMETGVSYLYPKNHAEIQVSFDGEKCWKEEGTHIRFTRRKVHTGMSVKEFMELMGAGEEGWVCTEIFEAGNGKWNKGTAIEYKDDKAKDAIEKFGWGKSRGTKGCPPVFVVMHKK